MTSKPYYISLAIPYANGKLHIGHAYEAIGGDAIARFQRAEGRDVFFQAGMDEHGQKIGQTADKSGVDRQTFVDGITAEYQALLQTCTISNNDFIRTTDQKRHWPTVQAIWQKMLVAGDIYLGAYKGWYSVRDEAYYDESEITTTPTGSKQSPHGTPVEWMEEECYFFRLSRYTDKLLQLYDSQPDFIQPASRRNEIYSFVKGGLRDLCVSRTAFDWGLPVPNEPKHVMYVWVDALTNYISTLGAYTATDDLFQKYWLGAPDRVHIIGKDITRFHTVYWPAFLMSAGLPLPTCVHAHGFIYDKTGQKMSKSLGNVVDPFALVEKYSSDAFRYFLLREVAYGQDGHVDYGQLPIRCNADLANEFGNLAQRSLSMINKNCDGKMPTPGALTAEDEAALTAPQKVLPVLRATMDKYEIHNALAALWRVMSETNGYFAGQEPWALKKTDPARMATVLWVTANAVRQLAILAAPFIPVGTAQILDLLAVPHDARAFAHLPQHVTAGTALPVPTGVYPRFTTSEEAAAE